MNDNIDDNNIISSPNNKLLKLVKGLINSKKDRDDEDLFVIEGIKTINEISNDFCIKYLIIDEAFQEKVDVITCVKNKNALKSILRVIPSKAFTSLTSMASSEGIMAVVSKKHYQLDDILTKKSLRLILLDQINDPGNLGTIIRTADAFGIDAICISKNSVDMYNPKVTRSTMGSMFHLPIIDNIDSEKLLESLKKANIKTFATNLQSKNYMDDIKNKFNKDESICIIIGNESHGVDKKLIELSDDDFKIYMNGNAESLNVSIAASIVMYEMTK